MKTFQVYYRGQPITTVEAANETAAAKKYYKQWQAGTLGTTMFADVTDSTACRAALEASKVVPGTKAV